MKQPVRKSQQVGPADAFSDHAIRLERAWINRWPASRPARGEHDDRNAGGCRIFPDFPQEAEPVAVGHRNVGDDDIGTATLDLDEGRGAARRGVDVVLRRLEHDLQHVQHDGTVVHDEHRRSAGGRFR